ncbi:MAG: redox-sensing transcriptional repressor Rex [Chloroflexi bacterium]|jgi:redox-sensing transcriptional repressor|nr:redox-sensing transcriptional repressor Rex [Chloroflexota bacterium]
MGSCPAIPLPSLRRLPIYYRRLRRAIDEGQGVISSQELGEAADVPAAQVRKDLSHVGEVGRPGIGYDVAILADYLEHFLGLVNDKEAVLVGVGNLGRALVSYPGFTRYGLRIVALFDSDPAKVGQTMGEHRILPVSKLADLTRRLHVQMGIITVPGRAAQEVADQMVAGGVSVIWNFAPATLQVPDEVLVKNEDLAAELATLSHHINLRHLENRSS